MIHCARCENQRWVCEAHPERPWGSECGCPCGAAGDPCPICNRSDAQTVPAVPHGFVAEAARDFDPLLDSDEDDRLREALARIQARAKRKIG
jgi:hypothetical protein